FAICPKVTPAQATSDSSNMSPEHANNPLPPRARCTPTSFPDLLSNPHVPAWSTCPSARSVIRAAAGSAANRSRNAAPTGERSSSAFIVPYLFHVRLVGKDCNLRRGTHARHKPNEKEISHDRVSWQTL